MTNEGAEKVLMIIAHRNFRDEEFLEPKKIFEKNGLKVVVASSRIDEAKGILGLRYKPDITLYDVNVEDYSIICFIGGPGSTEYWDDNKAHEIARETVSLGKVLGAICLAPVTLANAGLLKNINATAFSSALNTLIKKGANCTGKDVEKDGLIVTASGPSAAKEFGVVLMEALKENPVP